MGSVVSRVRAFFSKEYQKMDTLEEINTHRNSGIAYRETLMGEELAINVQIAANSSDIAACKASAKTHGRTAKIVNEMTRLVNIETELETRKQNVSKALMTCRASIAKWDVLHLNNSANAVNMLDDVAAIERVSAKLGLSAKKLDTMVDTAAKTQGKWDKANESSQKVVNMYEPVVHSVVSNDVLLRFAEEEVQEDEEDDDEVTRLTSPKEQPLKAHPESAKVVRVLLAK